MVTSLFWQLNVIHLHKHQERIYMAIERKQFRFSGIECHKPACHPIPQYYAGLTQLHQSISPSQKTDLLSLE